MEEVTVGVSSTLARRRVLFAHCIIQESLGGCSWLNGRYASKGATREREEAGEGGSGRGEDEVHVSRQVGCTVTAQGNVNNTPMFPYFTQEIK